MMMKKKVKLCVSKVFTVAVGFEEMYAHPVDQWSQKGGGSL
jgi:hypothetical protein